MIDKLQLALELFDAGDLENARKIVEGYRKELQTMDLISREEAIQKIREMPIEFFGRSLTRKSVVKAELEELPIIESRPKGEWIEDIGCCECFNCGWLITEGDEEINNYCPHCGAYMRGKE